MELAIAELKKCSSEDERKPHPRVGVVVWHEGHIAKAHRGEDPPGAHAEFTVLNSDHKLAGRRLPGGVLYTTLEPCTTRMHPKKGCWEWIVEKGIGTVVIGILDPNPDVCGIGEWLLKSKGVRVDRFPPDLQAQIEDANADFIKHHTVALFKKLSRLQRFHVVNLPCAFCGEQQDYTVRPVECVTNNAVDCPQCEKRFFVHFVGEAGTEFFTSRDGRDDYGISPAEGLSLPNAVRWALKRKQGWIEPREVKGILRLMADTEKELRGSKDHISPKDLMKAMVNSERISRYQVSTKKVRNFFRFIVRSGYFENSSPGRSAWNSVYTRTVDLSRCTECFLEGCLFVLRRARVILTREQAGTAGAFILGETGADGRVLGEKIWDSRLVGRNGS